jgi:ABC-type branched-subunit amino acid transport system substrate-binding protein
MFDQALESRLAADGGTEQAVALECRTHMDCLGRPDGAAACVQPEGRCVTLKSAECPTITGALSTPDAIVLGSLFSVSGAQAATNLPRQRSALLALEELNSFGGVPGAKEGAPTRPLVMVSCDEASNLALASKHLVNELKVPAIVGPNVSQDVIDLSNHTSVSGGTLLISPTAVASSIADLADKDLTWVMVPSDEQRAPLMVQQINEIEADLRALKPDQPVKLSIIHRMDALGMGTRVALNELTLNGQRLSENLNGARPSVTIEPYDASATDQSALVGRQLMFAPSIVVLAGLAEAVTQIVQQLEQRWGAADRPYYVTIDSLKVPELLSAARDNDSLRTRVRGTGIVPTTESAPVFDAFRVDYQTRWPGGVSTLSGMGPSYDATYAVAFALAATREQPVSGASIAAGLHKLGQGSESKPLQSTTILSTFMQLNAGKSVNVTGTFGPLAWDANGSPLGGRVEIWCIARSGSDVNFASSGITMDLKSQRIDGGHFMPCN